MLCKLLKHLSNVHRSAPHMLYTSKQEPLELFCFILAIVYVSFVFLLIPHSVFFFFFFLLLPLREYVNVHHCGTMTVTAGRRGGCRTVACPPQMAVHVFLLLKQTQKAAEGPGPVCRMCWGRVGTWHK